VLVVAQGPREAAEKLLQLLEAGATPGRVDNVVADWSPTLEQICGFTER